MYSDNPMCSGGPHLSSSYDDYIDDSFYTDNLVPAFGFEVFCNMSGRYTFFVSTIVPSVEVSICTVAVFGTSYIRIETLTDTIVIQAGDQSVLSVPHVFAEDVIGDQLAIELRQKAGSEIPFVSFINFASSTDVVIDATGVLPGEYTLVLESFDTNSDLQELTLKTDIITIVVAIQGNSDTLPYFVAELEPVAITFGQSSEWTLPQIIEN